MPPNQQPQPGQVVQPQQPAQPQQSNNYDFTQQNPQQPQQQPTQPQQPAFDPNAFKQEVVDAVKNAVQPQQPQPQQPQQQQPQQNQPEYFNKQYDDWGVLEQDTKKLVSDVIDEKLNEVNQQQTEAQKQATEQEKQNQEAIDNTLNQLRGAGYLPPVTNPLDTSDPGKDAENELIGYAVSLGTTNLVEAAKELKFKHDNGLKYDYQSKQWVNNGQQPQQSGPSMFGNLPQTPDGQQPAQQPVQQPAMQPPQAQGYPQPVATQPYGPQNPYAQPPQQYPPGFNAPVASGGGYGAIGMAGQVPNLSTLRNASYDQLTEMFQRTQ